MGWWTSVRWGGVVDQGEGEGEAPVALVEQPVVDHGLDVAVQETVELVAALQLAGGRGVTTTGCLF